MATIATAAYMTPNVASPPLKPAKLYLNGFPKSGLHLADRMAVGMLAPLQPDWNWFGTNAWTTERHNLPAAALALGGIKPGTFIKGHMGYLKALEALFVGLGIGMVFVYRDLRDVVVSMAHHIHDQTHKDNLYFPYADDFTGLDLEATMIGVIEGRGELVGLIERWETYAPWLDCEWVLKIPFKEMRHKNQRAAGSLFDYLFDVAMDYSGMQGSFTNPRIRKAAIAGILTEMKQTQLSPTYRQGKTGSWKRAFTPAVTAAFKAHDPGWLVRLGYAKDGNW